jgi:hypothetical protein
MFVKLLFEIFKQLESIGRLLSFLSSEEGV